MSQALVRQGAKIANPWAIDAETAADRVSYRTAYTIKALYSLLPGGVQTDIRLVFPLPNVPLVGNIFAQFTDMNASGNSVGVPMTVNNQNWAFGGGLTGSFSEEPWKVVPGHY